jgi:hypothetical protein
MDWKNRENENNTAGRRIRTCGLDRMVCTFPSIISRVRHAPAVVCSPPT